MRPTLVLLALWVSLALPIFLSVGCADDFVQGNGAAAGGAVGGNQGAAAGGNPGGNVGGNQGGANAGGAVAGGNQGQPLFTVTRESLDSAGQQGNARSRTPWLSSVAFDSEATNLVSNDTNGVQDIFFRDTQTGATSRVSVSSAGVQADQRSAVPTLSADDRIVVFTSFATNLVPNDTNGVADVFVHDRQTGQSTRVSVDSAGIEGNGQSTDPGVSADGRFVVFSSLATNLVPNDTNGVSDIFLHDRQTATTTRVSLDAAGVQANGQSIACFISADGSTVVFSSDATNLVANDTNGVSDVFARVIATGVTTRVSVSSAGVQQNAEDSTGDFRTIVCSADGRFVVFSSFATNLVPQAVNGLSQVYLHDRQTGTTTLMSADVNGVVASAESAFGFVSQDGRFVTFESDAANLVPNDTNGVSDVFLRDLANNTIQRVSVDASGNQGNAASGRGVISPDNRFIGYESNASNLVPDDTNGVTDVFRVRNPQVP